MFCAVQINLIDGAFFQELLLLLKFLFSGNLSGIPKSAFAAGFLSSSFFWLNNNSRVTQHNILHVDNEHNDITM